MWDLIVSVPDHCLSFYFDEEWLACFVFKAMSNLPNLYNMDEYSTVHVL